MKPYKVTESRANQIARKAFYICFCWAFVIWFSLIGLIQGFIEGVEYFFDLMNED